MSAYCDSCGNTSTSARPSAPVVTLNALHAASLTVYGICPTSSLLLTYVLSPHLAGKSLHGMEKQLLLVANAHMHWDPEYSDVKLVQTMMFLSEVKNIVDKATRSLKLSSVSGETNAIPLVLCADLNSLPDSGK